MQFLHNIHFLPETTYIPLCMCVCNQIIKNKQVNHIDEYVPMTAVGISLKAIELKTNGKINIFC